MARYRSDFEARCGAALGHQFEHEPIKLPYVVSRTYIPDFVQGDVIVEAKGRFAGSDRSKMLAVKQAHPHLRIAFVFQRPDMPIRKGSKTTCKEWALKHGFEVWSLPI